MRSGQKITGAASGANRCPKLSKKAKERTEFDISCESWDKEDLAYSSCWLRVDAKQYYIPQTRTRRYMICLNRRLFASVDQADEAAQQWKHCMVALERKASAPVEAFLLPEDDPRLQYAKDEMSKTGKLRRETDWEVHNGRHEDYRAIFKSCTIEQLAVETEAMWRVVAGPLVCSNKQDLIFASARCWVLFIIKDKRRSGRRS